MSAGAPRPLWHKYSLPTGSMQHPRAETPPCQALLGLQPSQAPRHPGKFNSTLSAFPPAISTWGSPGPSGHPPWPPRGWLVPVGFCLASPPAAQPLTQSFSSQRGASLSPGPFYQGRFWILNELPIAWP